MKNVLSTRVNLPYFEELGSTDEEYLEDEYIEFLQEEKFPKYVSLVNDILDSYDDVENLKEFIVDVPSFEGGNPERWFEFALSSTKIEIIEINLTYFFNSDSGFYTFPRLIANMAGLPGLKSLKELCLKYIHIDDMDFDFLVTKLVSLEKLSIENSERLKKVVVNGGVEKLEELEISDCLYLESVEVSNVMNLVCLKCWGSMVYKYILRLHNVPKLTHFQTSGNLRNSIEQVLSGISVSVRDQLLRLKLATNPLFLSIRDIPKLKNLKHMELLIDMHERDSAFSFFQLIEACPLLEKLEVNFWGYPCDMVKDGEPEEWYSQRHKHLKMVTFSGYVGWPIELEFAIYILKSAVRLEEFIVESCDRYDTAKKEAAAAHAREKFPPLLRKFKPFFVVQPESPNLHYVAKKKLAI
ncbi:hypothetical protein ACP275_08G252400 [Erythranthe tilingii]